MTVYHIPSFRTLLLVVLASWGLTLAGTTPADPHLHRRDQVRELMEVSRSQATMKQSMEYMLQQMAGGMAAQDPELGDMATEMYGLLLERIDYEQLNDLMVDMYLETFTEREIQAMLSFYGSPEGQSMLDKMPGMLASYGGQVQGVVTTWVEQVVAEMEHRIEHEHEHEHEHTPAPAEPEDSSPGTDHP